MPKNLFMSSVILVLISVSFFVFLVSNKAAASTVVTYVIDASKDDAWSKIDDVKWDTDEYYLSSVNMRAGCRWRMDIPKGGLILNANFICRAKNEIEEANTKVRIEVFDQDSCADFDEIFWNWPVMDEYVDWKLPDPFLPDMWYTSPDFKTIIQAYINRPGYKINNYIGLRIKFQSGNPAGHEVLSWDFNPDSAAKLEITYMLPEPPVASFAYTLENPIINETITFNATASYSPDGSIVKYSWNFGDATPIVNENDPITTHTYVKHGNYNVALNVTDSNGLWGIASKNITVWAPPVALFTYSPSKPVADESITFDASSSYDLDGPIVDYTWSFGDGNITVTNERVMFHTYTEHGNYNVTLTVVDNDGYSNFMFCVIPVNIHDIAILNVTVFHTEVYIGQVVNITVTAKNEGTTMESFNVTVFHNETLIGTQLVSNLAPDAEKILNFYWNTSDVTDTGDFLIKAEADVVSGESDASDNKYAGDIVKVSDISPSSFSLDWNWILPILIPPILFFVVGIWWKKRRASQKFRDFGFFDEITDGGIPDSFSVLITGEPGSGKSVLCQQLTYTFLTREKSCIYITYDSFPDEVRENMEKFHWNISKYENEEKFVFIDSFSSTAKVTSKEKYSVNQPFSLSDLGITMSTATNERADVIIVFLDSIVPLLTHVDPSKVVEFLQNRSARIKGVKGTFIFTIGKETIEPNLISRLEEAVDCVIELEVSKGKTVRRMRIKKMRGRKTSGKWIRFEIDSAKGIVFLV